MKNIIETKRLLLRKITYDDAEAVFECWCRDGEVTRWLTWNAHKSVDETRMIVKKWVNEYDDPKTVRYLITDKLSGATIGMIDVVSVRAGEVPVIGYCSGKKFWNQGYMTEACKAFLRELQSLGYKSAVIRARIENIGSNRVIQKCGGIFTGAEWEFIESKNEVVQCNSYVVDLRKSDFDLQRYWQAVCGKDAEKMRQFFADNAVIRWHNTDEVFPVDKFIAVNCDYPDNWSFEIERDENYANKITSVTRVYSLQSNLSFHAVSFFEVSNDKITALDEYWGDDDEPPKWRTD